MIKKERLTVYCDGFIHGNNCSVGIWFGVEDPRNQSVIVVVPGKQTVNTAKLEAISRVLDVVDGEQHELQIKTNLQYCVQMLMNDREPGANAELIRAIRNKMENREVTIVWTRDESEQGSREAKLLAGRPLKSKHKNTRENNRGTSKKRKQPEQSEVSELLKLLRKEKERADMFLRENIRVKQQNEQLKVENYTLKKKLKEIIKEN